MIIRTEVPAWESSLIPGKKFLSESDAIIAEREWCVRPLLSHASRVEMVAAITPSGGAHGLTDKVLAIREAIKEAAGMIFNCEHDERLSKYDEPKIAAE
jgi:hypothetical protein